MEEELTEEVEMAKRRIDEINMELNQVIDEQEKKNTSSGNCNSHCFRVFSVLEFV